MYSTHHDHWKILKYWYNKVKRDFDESERKFWQMWNTLADGVYMRPFRRRRKTSKIGGGTIGCSKFYAKRPHVYPLLIFQCSPQIRFTRMTWKSEVEEGGHWITPYLSFLRLAQVLQWPVLPSETLPKQNHLWRRETSRATSSIGGGICSPTNWCICHM